MSTSVPKFHEESIRCRLCSKVYEQPRILPCLHSFCGSCLHDYISGNRKPVKAKTPTLKSDTNQPDVVTTTDNVGKQRDVNGTQKPQDAGKIGESKPKPGKNKTNQTQADGKQTMPESPTKDIKGATLTSPVKDITSKSPKPGDRSGNDKQQKAKTKPGGTSQNANANPTKSAAEDGSKEKTVVHDYSATGHQDNREMTLKTPKQDGKPQTTDDLHFQGPRAPTDLSMKGFPCPCCRKFITTPALPRTTKDKWMTLFPVNNLLSDLVDLHSLKAGTRTCDPCRRNKTKSKLHSYCKNCRDALCENCAKTHKGLRSCKNHKVLSTNEFADAINSLKVDEEYCPRHEEKQLDQYCYTHDSLCCALCVNELHKLCARVVGVAEAAKKTRAGQDVQKLEGSLDRYREYVGSVKHDRAALLKRLDSKKSKVLNEFIGIKANIVAQLEKMEKDLNTMLEATHRLESKKVKSEMDKCQEIESAVTNTKEFLKIADKHGSDSQVVETVEKVKQECEYYEENMSILCSNMKNTDYNIALDPSLQQVMKRLNQFGRIDVHSTGTNYGPTPKFMRSLGFQTSHAAPQPKVKAVKPLHTQADQNLVKEVADFCARFSEDGQECWFTGACFLPDGRIVLADRTNRKLKLFTKEYEPLAELLLSSKPWDVTVINDKQVAVSLPAECKIQFVSITESMLRLARTMSSDEPCFGLYFANDKILTVTYDGDPVNLRILSLTGEELAFVCVDDDGLPLFSKPIYVTSNSDVSVIYVSDERQGCVVTLTESGELNFTTNTIDIGHAAGLVVDKVGNVYVCDNSSNCVHQITNDGERDNVIVSGSAISYPRAVTYDPRDKRLLVTQGDQDSVKVYSLVQ